MDSIERELFARGIELIAGVDEVGRGPLAGPVVAAAVVFLRPLPLKAGIRDSKTLSPKRRSELAREIKSVALATGVGMVGHADIDKFNIHNATLLAMRRAVERLSINLSRNFFKRPDYLLIDGPHRIDSKIPQIPVVKGDSLSVSIAGASIIAKTCRDRLMRAYDRRFPGYNFAGNKGYGTREHLSALLSLGPCPVHRRTFRGVLRES